MPMKRTTADLLAEIRKTAPLIHNITNMVVMNATANILLAVGASPVMAHSRHEAEEMASMAGALVINIGTLSDPWVEAMLLAARAANRTGCPVILDPVGAGATAYRSRSVRNLIDDASVSVIRGNASEVLSLVDAGVTTKGVDSSLALSDAAIDAARGIASHYGCVVAISGERDLITDGDRVLRVANGVPLMTRVTGLGCGLSAVVGAFCAVAGADRLAAVAAAFGFYGLCGELALKVSDRPGSFYVAFLDALYAAGQAEIDAWLKVDESG
ncbi:hydroxyethylthiazole kinase [Desulfosarcina ovata subsp. sediminis]|uniref:Hydroxyethylthiazole kinase n=1 Tax=Desulfosarcina ovata subsp. sediminis TaxID=885957 RepID=A0A5K7ZZD4_9BACT|nr:hydroxyethylthiazole kinase [Desulfosarcina ovata]BBO85639.1 hydroxyethylthiazole kinase [Desulfosarcina ovata subsp. sediminis]